MFAKAAAWIVAALGVALLVVGLIAWHQHGTIARQGLALAAQDTAIKTAVEANGSMVATATTLRAKLGQCTAEIATSAEAQAKALREREQQVRDAEQRARDLRMRNATLTAALGARCRAWAQEPVCVGVEAIP